MKKLSKLFVCIGLVLCLTFGLTACSVGEVEENTRTAVETTTSIVPVEFTQETAEGIFNNALYTLLSNEKVQLDAKLCFLEGVKYTENFLTQKVLIKNENRYVYLTDHAGEDEAQYVFGVYNDKQILIDLVTNKYKDFTPTGSNGDTVSIVVNLITSLDLIASTSKLSNHVVSGRYYDGATYINIQKIDTVDEVTMNIEVKIIDGKFASFEMFMLGENEEINGWVTYSFTYGSAVDVSMIPTTLDGFTLDA